MSRVSTPLRYTKSMIDRGMILLTYNGSYARDMTGRQEPDCLTSLECQAISTSIEFDLIFIFQDIKILRSLTEVGLFYFYRNFEKLKARHFYSQTSNIFMSTQYYIDIAMEEQ